MTTTSGVNGLPSRKVAAQLAAISNGLGMIGKANPAWAGITAPLGFYDAAYDARDLISNLKDPNKGLGDALPLIFKNILNIPFGVSKLSVGKYDDMISTAGFINDILESIE